MGMKALFTTVLFIFFHNLFADEEVSPHLTQQIFSKSENRLIKLTQDFQCIDSSSTNFQSSVPVEKFSSMSDCEFYLKNINQNNH
jgi:hypothetical protein